MRTLGFTSGFRLFYRCRPGRNRSRQPAAPRLFAAAVAGASARAIRRPAPGSVRPPPPAGSTSAATASDARSARSPAPARRRRSVADLPCRYWFSVSCSVRSGIGGCRCAASLLLGERAHRRQLVLDRAERRQHRLPIIRDRHVAGGLCALDLGARCAPASNIVCASVRPDRPERCRTSRTATAAVRPAGHTTPQPDVREDTPRAGCRSAHSPRPRRAPLRRCRAAAAAAPTARTSGTAGNARSSAPTGDARTPPAALPIEHARSRARAARAGRPPPTVRARRLELRLRLHHVGALRDAGVVLVLRDLRSARSYAVTASSSSAISLSASRNAK